MSEFERDVIERLTRLETTLNNGVRADIAAVKKWIEPRPKTCPLVERRNIFVRPITVALLTAAGMKALDLLPTLWKVGP